LDHLFGEPRLLKKVGKKDWPRKIKGLFLGERTKGDFNESFFKPKGGQLQGGVEKVHLSARSQNLSQINQGGPLRAIINWGLPPKRGIITFDF